MLKGICRIQNYKYHGYEHCAISDVIITVIYLQHMPTSQTSKRKIYGICIQFFNSVYRHLKFQFNSNFAVFQSDAICQTIVYACSCLPNLSSSLVSGFCLSRIKNVDPSNEGCSEMPTWQDNKLYSNYFLGFDQCVQYNTKYAHCFFVKYVLLDIIHIVQLTFRHKLI